jgi:tetratricopeptide (TPR) repeat protein
VAGVTAVLTLVLAARQVVTFVGEYRARSARRTALIATSRLQADAGDFPAAWASLNQVLKSDTDNRPARVAREDLAQLWLEHARTGGGIASLSQLADTLSPVLTEGLLHSDSTRKADILAHLGWADFLRWREGQRGLNPPARYRESLALDPHNPYAHAMLGHWLLWDKDSLAGARDHFGQALAAGRARAYVRGMQIAALANRRTSGSAIELIRVGNDMRNSGEPPAEARDALWTAFLFHLGATSEDQLPTELTSAVSPADLLATYRWAFEASGYPEGQGTGYALALAQLQQLAGDTEAALKAYQAALAERGLSAALRAKVSRAVGRIKAGH